MKARKTVVRRPGIWKAVIIIAVAAAVIWALIMTIAYYALVQTLNADQSSNTSNIVQLNYRVSELQFCSSHAITPCDDIAVRQWNATHSGDDHFNVLP